MAENVRIYLRIRPSRSEENNSQRSNCCLTVDPHNPHQAVHLVNGNKAEAFTYDCVGGPETEQEAIFESVAKPVTEYCLHGYNGTIFAYGQTGSGKTFTMQGPMTEANLIDFSQRGLIPRTFEYLFECIRAEEEQDAENGREFLCKCSYVEIYNETIFDLLEATGSAANTCNLREDIKRGVYIEGAREEIINSPSEAYEVYERGSLNRHVAETSMNRESSRSHSVFTLFIQSKQRVGEIIDIRESRFNLVDLAGSERQQMTGTTGQRLKEAGNINKSLLALSNVINGLVDISNGRPRHVQYRDSRLTFLLRDSLGGNAKTVIIANVSPSSLYYNETLSTLKFAQRAKMIKNKAVVNKDIQGNVLQLQAEIQRLQHELYMSRHTETPEMMLIDSTKKPRLSGENNSELLDPAEAYLMLTMALERQAECSDEIESYRSRVHLLEELSKRKESQNQSLRMILKFRENSLKSNEHDLDQDLRIAEYKEEIQELRKIIEHHPEVTRFAYENLQLREKLYKFEVNEKRMEEFEGLLDRHRQYEQLLTNRLLVLEKCKEQSLESDAREHEEVDDDDYENIPTRNIEMTSAEKGESDFDSLNDRISELEKDLKVEKEKNSELRREMMRIGQKSEGNNSEIRVENSRLADVNSKLESENSRLSDVNSKLINENSRLENENSRSLNEINALKNNFKNQVSQISLENEKLISDITGITDLNSKLTGEISRLTDELASLLEENGKLSRENVKLNEEILGNEEISGVLQVERESLSKLMQEKEEIEGKFQVISKQLEREKENCKSLLNDYEKARGEFNEKILELNAQIDSGRGEIEGAIQKVKAYQAEKTLIQQELEVTRQILAEYKSRDQSTASAQIQAAEVAGKRISDLETEINSLKEDQIKSNALAATATSLADRNKILQAENAQLHGKIGKLEFLMRSAQGDNDELMAQVTQLQKHFEASLNTNSSSTSSSTNSALNSQLEAANHTITSLKRQLTTLESDLSSLRSENEKLMQHQNLKQKLQYHLKIKQENNELQEELTKCKDELGIIKGVLSEIKAGKGLEKIKSLNL